MPVSFQYDRERMILNMRAVGVLTIDELLDYLYAVISDDTIEAGFIEVADFSAVQDLEISFGDTGPFEDIWCRYLDKGCLATIVFAPGDLSFGVSRMFQTVIRNSKRGSQGNFMVVRSQEEAQEIVERLRSEGSSVN